MDKVRRNAVGYFALQGLAVSLWWLCLWFIPSTRVWFRMGADDTMLMAFWLPDIVVLAAGSFVVAVLLKVRSDLIVPAVWTTTGASAYACLYCLSFAMTYDSGWLGVILMNAMTIVGGNFAVGVTPTFAEGMFRRSSTREFRRVVVKTFAQIVVVWSLILVVVPTAIIWIEDRVGIPRLTFQFQKPLALLLLPLVSSLGVSAAWTMSKVGGGTPLPMDTANSLVFTGAYRYVRNPMAISGIAQGLVVALFHGSALVAIYALTGCFIWQMIFRPLEEEDLLKTFGDDYEKYRQTVQCWIPRRARQE